MTETTVKKTTTRKTTASASATATKEVAEKETKAPVVEKRVLKDTDEILVMNNTTGRYGYQSPNGFSFDLEEYGQTLTIPLKELRVMASGKARVHLTNAWLLILDEDVVKTLNLGNVYQNVYTQEEMEDLFKNHKVFEEVFEKMPSGMQLTAIKTAQRLAKEDKLTDYRIMKVVKQLTNIDITPQD